MKDEKRMRAKNGRSGISGTCTVCGGKMFKMIGGGAKATGKAKIPSKQRSKKVGKGKRKAKSEKKQYQTTKVIKKTAGMPAFRNVGIDM